MNRWNAIFLILLYVLSTNLSRAVGYIDGRRDGYNEATIECLKKSEVVE